MDFPREVRPAQSPRKLMFQPLLVVACPFASKFDLPAAEVVQQAHIGLDKDRKSTGTNDEVGIDQGQTEVFHDIGDLS